MHLQVRNQGGRGVKVDGFLNSAVLADRALEDLGAPRNVDKLVLHKCCGNRIHDPQEKVCRDDKRPRVAVRARAANLERGHAWA